MLPHGSLQKRREEGYNKEINLQPLGGIGIREPSFDSPTIVNEPTGGIARGTLYLTIASISLFFSGLIIHFSMGRYLGPEEYGDFGVILSLMGAITIVLMAGIPDAASKYISENDSCLGSVVRQSRRIQAVITLLLFSLYFGLAGPIANLFDDPDLARYVRISALVIPTYALYYLHYGYLNGLRLFGKQAKTQIAVSVARVGLVLALVFSLGVEGVILGYVLGALAGLILALVYLRKLDRGSTEFEWIKLLKFGIPATLFAVMLFVLMNVDLLAVKAMMSDDADAGYYTSATTIARMSYWIFGALALALFPYISFATSRKDSRLTATYINQSMRSMLMLLIPGILLVSATSSELLSLLYSSRYVEADNALSVLVFGQAFLTVLLVLTHIIMGGGKPNTAFGIALVAVAVDIVMNIVLISRYGLVGAAWATTVATSIGMIMAGIYVLRRYKALVSAGSFVKICLASLAVYAVALQVSPSPKYLLFIYMGLFALYFGLLLLMRELTKGDVEALKRIIPLARFNQVEEKSK